MKSTKLLYITCWVTIGLTGCATYEGKSYDGPKRARSEVGAVIFNKMDNQFVLPCKVDDVRVNLGPKDRSVEMLPGKHKVLFLYANTGRREVAIEWTFQVEAGKNYLITFPEQQSTSSTMLWLEDPDSGARITDVTSSPLKLNWSCLF